MGTDHSVQSGCLIPVSALLKTQLPKSKTKKIVALVHFCEAVNNSAREEKCGILLNVADAYLDEILQAGAAILTKCKVPVSVAYQAVGVRADGKSQYHALEKSTVAAAKAELKATEPECKLKKVNKLYSAADGQSLLCMDFVHPDCGYDDFSGEQQLYFRLPEASLWASSGQPNESLKCLCKKLGISADAFAPVSWVSILY